MTRFATRAPLGAARVASAAARVASAAALVASCAAFIASCAAPPSEPPRAGRAGRPRPAAAAVPPMPKLAPVTKEEAQFYRRAFADAAEFLPRPIPAEMIRSLDQGNEAYIEARDARGETLGYLRDFVGPVTPDTALGIPALDLTLVFDIVHQLTSILAPGPIPKQAGANLTPAEVERLTAIAQDPPEALQALRRVEDVLDAANGAVKPEFAPLVVDGAALVTARVVQLARDTSRILQAAPRVWDRRRLQQILTAQVDDATGRARALAVLLPGLDTPEAGTEAYRAMVRAYIEAQQVAGANPDKTVEGRIIAPGIDPATDAREAVDACYGLVNADVRLAFADRCGRLVASSGAAVDPASLARLLGTLAYLAGETKQALAPLRQAAAKYELLVDPRLHYRLADALRAQKQFGEACTAAKSVYRLHPLLPGAKKLLEACRPEDRDIVPVLEELNRELRQELVASRLSDKPQMPTVAVEDESFTSSDVSLFETGKVTVAVFFSTWCPHCRVELPQLVTFARMVEKNPRLAGNVRVLAVRTAVEQETEPYEAFKARLKPNFPIWTDPVMALAFSKVAKSLGIPPALPTLVVIDAEGYPQYLLPPGDFRDVVRELHWAVEDVLGLGPAANPAVPEGAAAAPAATDAPAVAPEPGGGAPTAVPAPIPHL